MDDDEGVAMRVLVAPSGIGTESVIVVETNGLSPELGGMGQFPCSPGFRFVIPV